MNNKTTKNLAHLMQAAGISENELARQTGVLQPTIHRILNGESRDPRRRTLAPLADFFSVTVEQLIDGDLTGWAPGDKPSEAEKEMAELLQMMNEEQKKAIVNLIRSTLNSLNPNK